MVLPKNPSAPFPSGYEAETYISSVIAGERATSYQSFIGVLRWTVDLRRIEMITEMLMLSSHLEMPRAGHISTVFFITPHWCSIEPTQQSIRNSLTLSIGVISTVDPNRLSHQIYHRHVANQ